MRSFVSSLFLLCAVAASSAGCGAVTPPTACTLIGCSDGLEVRFERRPEVPFRVEVEVPGRSSRFVYECADPDRCGEPIFFADFTPDHARIHVTTAAGTVVHPVQPRYEEVQPNGADCPPSCRIARVVVPVPRAAD